MGRSATTSDDILASARVLISAGGYNGFSYADIAEVIGIRKASIHHHFPGKADLVRTLVQRYRRETEQGLGELERQMDDPVERLRAYFGYWSACIADARAPICICALLAGELPALPEAVAVEVRAHFRMLAAWLASSLSAGARQGRVRLTGTAEAEAELVMATVHGAMLSARAYGEAAAFDRVIRPLLERLAG